MGIDLTTGVEITDKRRRTKDINSKTVSGVAGLSIVQAESVVRC